MKYIRKCAPLICQPSKCVSVVPRVPCWQNCTSQSGVPERPSVRPYGSATPHLSATTNERIQNTNTQQAPQHQTLVNFGGRSSIGSWLTSGFGDSGLTFAFIIKNHDLLSRTCPCSSTEKRCCEMEMGKMWRWGGEG